MSFDIFLQRFTDGLPVEADAASIRALLEPVVVATDGGWAELETSDGGADIYGYDNLASGFMINHAVGDAVWDLLMAVAAAGQLAIMPVGCPTCVSDASMLADLPAELATEAAVVTSGSGLVGLIRTSQCRKSAWTSAVNPSTRSSRPTRLPPRRMGRRLRDLR